MTITAHHTRNTAAPHPSNTPRFGRIGLAGSGAVLLAALTACSGGDTSAQQPQPSGNSDTNATSVSINDPKDASAVALCQLLSPEEARSLGYKPQGHEEEGGLEKDSPKVCEWDRSGNSAAQLGMGVLERRIADYYANPGAWSGFGKLTIAGHPAVRATRATPCSPATATCTWPHRRTNWLPLMSHS